MIADWIQQKPDGFFTSPKNLLGVKFTCVVLDAGWYRNTLFRTQFDRYETEHTPCFAFWRDGADPKPSRYVKKRYAESCAVCKHSQDCKKRRRFVVGALNRDYSESLRAFMPTAQTRTRWARACEWADRRGMHPVRHYWVEVKNHTSEQGGWCSFTFGEKLPPDRIAWVEEHVDEAEAVLMDERNRKPLWAVHEERAVYQINKGAIR